MKHFLFIICLLNAFNCWSQTYTIKRLGMEKGLSNNFVIDIAEDMRKTRMVIFGLLRKKG